ncbi:MAG TPA: VOC family protein [Comamonas sp.]
MSEVCLLHACSVRGLHHVQLSFAPKLQTQMEHFYGQLLGLRRSSHSAVEHVLSYAVGGQRIDLVPLIGQAVQSGGHAHLALQVTDAYGLQQYLSHHGAMVLSVAQVPEGLRFYAKDPAGNTLELLQPFAALQPASTRPTLIQHAVCA